MVGTTGDRRPPPRPSARFGGESTSGSVGPASDGRVVSRAGEAQRSRALCDRYQAGAQCATIFRRLAIAS